MSSNPPPGRDGFLIGVRESIEYLVNGDQFIADRLKEFGPVFSTTLFFRPTVVVGGQKSVSEFLAVDSDIAESSLPPPLQELMTERNTLLQTGERHMASRRMISPVLDLEALKTYLPIIERRADLYVKTLSMNNSTLLAKDLTTFCLQLYAEIFTGHPLTEEQERLFTTYNGGLFALSTLDPSFRKARSAREALEQDMELKYLAARDAGQLESDRFAVFRHISSAVDESGAKSYGVGYAVTQFVWGAYIETASQISFALINLATRPECAQTMRAECQAAGVLKGGALFKDWSLPYVTGVLRESMRTTPPAGGGFRIARKPIKIGGFDIEEGIVVTADPRIGNKDPVIFPSPDDFKPERWMSAGSATATLEGGRCPFTGTAATMPRGGWFPGGTGEHQCPGVPLAELCSKVVLAKWVDRFESWDEANGPPDMILVPIKIPKDSYEISLKTRS